MRNGQTDIVFDEVSDNGSALVSCTIESADIVSSEVTCPVCGCQVTEDEDRHICQTCSTPHHKDCWEYAGGCAIFGCRKGVIRTAGEGTALEQAGNGINLGLMRLWSLLFRVHWLSFLATTLPILLMLIFGAVIGPVSQITGLLPGAEFAVSSVAGLMSLLVPLGALGYIALLPFAIAMRIHFHTINLSLPSGNSGLAKNIADRVDMPWTITAVRKISRFLSSVTLIFSKLFTGIYVLGFLAGANLTAFILGALFLFFVKLVLISMLFDPALESRVTMLMSFQNRLIATAKKAKQ